MTRDDDKNDAPLTLEDARAELVDAVTRAVEAGLSVDEVAATLNASLDEVERLTDGE